MEMFVNKMTNPDHDHVVKTLKGTENLTLTTCYFQVTNEATDLEKLQLGGIEPRSTRMTADSGERINFSYCTQKDGWIKSPHNARYQFSKN